MATVKVFGSPTSAEVARVLMCLFEKNVEFQLVRMDTYRGSKRMPEYLKLQPHGEALTFVDGSHTFLESRKICRHIADKYKDQGYKYLIGIGDLERSAVEELLQFEAQNFDKPSTELIFSLAFLVEHGITEKSKKNEHKTENVMTIYGNGKEQQEQEERKVEEMKRTVEARKNDLNTVLDIYDEMLEDKEYLTGDKFTLADLSHLPNTQQLASNTEIFKQLFTTRKNVGRWWKSISSRQCWQQVLKMQQLPAPTV